MRLRPHALAYNLANLLRIPALPDEVAKAQFAVLFGERFTRAMA